MSEKSPILQVIKLAQAYLDKLNLRERLLVTFTAIMLLGSVWYLGLMEPMQKQIENSRTEIETVRKRVQSINQDLEVQQAQASSGAIGMREQYTLVQRRLEELNEKLGGYTAELIGPGEMASVLQGVLKEQSNLRLVRMNNLTPEPLRVADSDDVSFYKHGLEIIFEGGYFAALEYLEQVESLPWRFYWQILELEVLEYPLNRIRIEVSTLSPHKEWIGA